MPAMKFTVEATPEELATKGPELLKAVARRLDVDPLDIVHPDDLLRKAGSQHAHGPELRTKALKEIQKQEHDLVQKTYSDMVKEISAVLDGKA